MGRATPRCQPSSLGRSTSPSLADQADGSYVQFVFNGSLVLGFLYVVANFVLAVQRDVKERIDEYAVGELLCPRLS